MSGQSCLSISRQSPYTLTLWPGVDIEVIPRQKTKTQKRNPLILKNRTGRKRERLERLKKELMTIKEQQEEEKEELIKGAKEAARAYVIKKKENIIRITKKAVLNMTTIKKYINKIPTITNQDLDTLDGHNSISDRIIEAGMATLANKGKEKNILCLEASFYTNLNQEVEKPKEQSVQEFQEIYIPIQGENGQWILSRFLPKMNMLITYDPLQNGDSSQKASKMIAGWIKERYEMEYIEEIHSVQFPLQTDNINSGIFILEYLRAILDRKHPDMGNIPAIKERWKNEMKSYFKKSEMK